MYKIRFFYTKTHRTAQACVDKIFQKRLFQLQHFSIFFINTNLWRGKYEKGNREKISFFGKTTKKKIFFLEKTRKKNEELAEITLL